MRLGFIQGSIEGDLPTQYFRRRIANLEAAYRKHSGFLLSDEIKSSGKTFVSINDVGAREILGNRIYRFHGEDTYRKFMAHYADASMKEIWGDVIYSIHKFSDGSLDFIRLKDMKFPPGVAPIKINGIEYFKAEDGKYYESILDYYVANFIFPDEAIRVSFANDGINNVIGHSNYLQNAIANGQDEKMQVFANFWSAHRDFTKNTMLGAQYRASGGQISALNAYLPRDVDKAIHKLLDELYAMRGDIGNYQRAFLVGQYYQALTMITYDEVARGIINVVSEWLT